MYQAVARGLIMALTRGPKRGQHYVDMDGVKLYYETFKQPKADR